MTKYEEGMNLLNERFGKGKDNVLALATLDISKSLEGGIRPSVRDVDAVYQDGVFYIVTYAKSNKVLQIEAHPDVSVSLNFEDFSAHGKAENLGYVLDPKNAEIRTLLREVFKEWYDFANDESDPNFCFVKIQLTDGRLRLDHGGQFYHFNFTDKTAIHNDYRSKKE